MTADLATLRALASETDELAANIRDQLGGWVLPVGSSAVVRSLNGHLSIVHTSSLGAWAKDVEALRAALLLACDEIAALRATLARMPLPTLTQFAAVSYAATRDPLTMRAWNDLAQAARDVIAGRVRYGLDYLAGGDGNGVIYSAGPGDPPPTSPPT